MASPQRTVGYSTLLKSTHKTTSCPFLLLMCLWLAGWLAGTMVTHSSSKVRPDVYEPSDTENKLIRPFLVAVLRWKGPPTHNPFPEKLQIFFWQNLPGLTSWVTKNTQGGLCKHKGSVLESENRAHSIQARCLSLSALYVECIYRCCVGSSIAIILYKYLHLRLSTRSRRT